MTDRQPHSSMKSRAPKVPSVSPTAQVSEEIQHSDINTLFSLVCLFLFVLRRKYIPTSIDI